MLGKLFRYEMKASGRIMLPVFGAALLMGIITTVLFGTVVANAQGENIILGLIAITAIALMVVFLFGGLILSYIYAIYRFKKNILGNEGYITNTLPVTTWSKILSKLFAASIYQLLALVIFIVVYGIFILVCANVGGTLDEVREAFREAWGVIFQDTNKVVMLIEVFAVILISFLFSNLMFYAAMAVGYSTKSHKLLASIGMYILFYVVIQTVSFIAIGVEMFILIGASEVAQFHAMMISSLAISIVFGGVFAFITYFFIDKRLNLQ